MRHPTSTSYIPAKIAGSDNGTYEVESNVEFGRGAYTLLANTTYMFMLGGEETALMGTHIQWDATIVITTIKIEDSCMPPSEVKDASTTAGEWIDEDPSTAFVGTVGAGVTVTNGVVAVAGGALGGAMFHMADNGARRVRLTVAVGATGGEVRVAGWAKER